MAAMIGSTSDGRLHRYTPFTTVTALAVAGCVAVIVVFGIIFAVLQVSKLHINMMWANGSMFIPLQT